MGQLIAALQVACLADIPYDIQLSNERYYRTILFVLLRLLAPDIDCEVRAKSERMKSCVDFPSQGAAYVLFLFHLGPC